MIEITPTIAIGYYLIIIIAYLFYKTMHIPDGSGNQQIVSPVVACLFIAAVLVGEYMISIGMIKSTCGFEQWGFGALVTFLPWVLMIGPLMVALFVRPGWLVPFSNTFGYVLASALYGLPDTFKKLMRPQTSIPGEPSAPPGEPSAPPLEPEMGDNHNPYNSGPNREANLALQTQRLREANNQKYTNPPNPYRVDQPPPPPNPYLVDQPPPPPPNPYLVDQPPPVKNKPQAGGQSATMDVERALQEIYEDESLLINQMTPENLDAFIARYTNAGIILNPAEFKQMDPTNNTNDVYLNLIIQIRKAVYFKLFVSEFIWLLLSGILVISITFNYIVNYGCEMTSEQIKAREEQLAAEADARAEELKKKNSLIVTRD